MGLFHQVLLPQLASPFEKPPSLSLYIDPRKVTSPCFYKTPNSVPVFIQLVHSSALGRPFCSPLAPFSKDVFKPYLLLWRAVFFFFQINLFYCCFKIITDIHAVFKLGQIFFFFPKVRKTDFWRKSSWQRVGRSDSSPKEGRDEGCCHSQLLFSSLLPNVWGKG